VEETQGRTVRVSNAQDGREYLDEGLCHHCGMAVQFRASSPAFIRVQSTISEGDELYRTNHEDFFVGICTRRTCCRTTVVRRYSFEQHHRGDSVGYELVEQEIVYPRRKSAREALPPEVPETLRKTFDEASAIEYESATACGFLAGRLLEQALRDRLLKDADGSAATKRELRKTGMAGLIQRFVDAGHATGDTHELIVLLQGFRNFAAHPPQPEDAEDLDIDGPQASFLLNAARELLAHIYVRPARIAEMKAQLEQKKRGEAIAHSREVAVSSELRKPGLPAKAFDPLNDDVDVPF
jgi:hypothetical protein